MTPVPTSLSASVVVPTYRRRVRCLRLLDTLASQVIDPTTFEVIIVDNGSDDGTAEAVELRRPTLPYSVRVGRIAVNRGPAAARNLGWRLAGAPVVAFTDDDCQPGPGWLAGGLAALVDPAVGVVQGRTTPPPGIDVATLPRWWHHQSVDGPTAQFEACNVFYRRSVLETTGGFDEGLGWWGEDAAAGWSAVEAGWERGFAPDAVVVHEVTARGLRWHLRNGLLEGNMVRVAAEHPGFRAAAFWRPWAFRREDAAFLLAVAGCATARRHPVAVVAALPYLWLRRPGSWTASGLRDSAECVPVDAARACGQLSGAVRNRVAVL